MDDITLLQPSSDEIQCRTCTKPCQHSTIFFLFKDAETIQMFTNCTNLELLQTDGLPEYICQSCYNQLRAFHSFRVQCASSDLFFRQNLLQDSIFDDDHITYENTSFEEETKIFIEQQAAAAQTIAPTDGYICDICNGTATFTTKRNLRQHFNKEHTLFRCPHNECSKSFGFRQNLKRHIDEFHANIRSRRTSKFPPRSCNICDRKFLKPHYHEAHMRLHNGLDPFECKLCNKTFRKWTTLNNHNQLHHNSIDLPKHSCIIENCSKMYKSIDSLRAHQKLMHQNNLSAVTVKSYICEYCGKSFTKRFLLKAHMYRHSGEQPFPCHLCPKKFVARYSLKLHLRRHAGIKSYSCSLCSTQKSTGAELKAHINQYHTQEKTYPCKECPAVFNGYPNLYAHVRGVHRMHKPYKCQYCDRAFAKTDALKHHTMIHTGEKPHACVVCSQRFIQASSLKKHILTHAKV